MGEVRSIAAYSYFFFVSLTKGNGCLPSSAVMGRRGPMDAPAAGGGIEGPKVLLAPAADPDPAPDSKALAEDTPVSRPTSCAKRTFVIVSIESLILSTLFRSALSMVLANFHWYFVIDFVGIWDVRTPL